MDFWGDRDVVAHLEQLNTSFPSVKKKSLKLLYTQAQPNWTNNSFNSATKGLINLKFHTEDESSIWIYTCSQNFMVVA